MSKKRNFTFYLPEELMDKVNKLLENDTIHIYQSINHFASTAIAKEIENYEKNKNKLLG